MLMNCVASATAGDGEVLETAERDDEADTATAGDTEDDDDDEADDICDTVLVA